MEEFMLSELSTRRNFLWIATAFALARIASPQAVPAKKEESEEEVGAVEDLMREHGILRRSLLVYTFAATKLRGNASAISPNGLQKTAKLFQVFGEDYHERQLEEAHIFPAVKKAGGRGAGFVDTLTSQHQRGREITDYIVKVSAGAKLNSNLAAALESFVLMYRHHAATEDTIVFPVWKKTLSKQQLDEMGEKFEEIEHRQFGKDGFDDAERQISDIEKELGLADLAMFTAPPPPKA
jgi:hemerythrin-like domain-containing protein